MPSKTLIDGTSYEISAGSTLIDNTIYSIDKGTTLVDGAQYEIFLYNWTEDLNTALEFTAPEYFSLGVEAAGWNGTLEYQNGSGWKIWDGSEIPAGERNNNWCLYLRGIGNTKMADAQQAWILNGSNIECNGTIEKLLDYNTVAAGEHPTMAENCFVNMFRNCIGLIKAPVLSSPVLSTGCYTAMFNGCANLVEMPDLPADILTPACYRGMFDGCVSLITAPRILATAFESTETADSCNWMFANCTSLINPPELNILTLAPKCYFYMFCYCTGLKTAPRLPATKLAHACYDGMFKGCTALETVPAIPAESAPTYACCEMFRNCTSLNAFMNPNLPSGWVDKYCYDNMFDGCTSLTVLPNLKATYLNDYCYKEMFKNCTGLALSEELIEDGDTFRIPTEGTIEYQGTDSLIDMFIGTSGTFTGTPIIETTYYLNKSNGG